MTSTLRNRLSLTLALLALTVPAAARAPGDDVIQPDRLVVLSTNEVNGKTGPCGCHIPKGGLARQASFADSLRNAFGQVLLVDNGEFFPPQDGWEDDARFLMQAMSVAGFDAVGVSERELRFGRAFLLANLKSTGLPMVCCNLYDRQSRKPLVAPWRIVRKGTVNVGVVSVCEDHVDPGISRDSVEFVDPVSTAQHAVAEMRSKGATVIVVLSQLGRSASEDLATQIPGVDLVVVGRNAPLVQRGRMVQKTMVCYGGTDGEYVGRTLITLDASRHAAAMECEAVPQEPSVGDNAAMVAMVTKFEDAFNKHVLALDQQHNAQAESTRVKGDLGASEQAAEKYLGVQVCGRCHPSELQQWRSTAHAKAWDALVTGQHDADVKCQPCHVLGFQRKGGFQGPQDSDRLGGVQCESCHGLGTDHEAFPETPYRITEATCRNCHTSSDDPAFDFALYEPHVLHRVPASMPQLPAHAPGHAMGAR